LSQQIQCYSGDNTDRREPGHRGGGHKGEQLHRRTDTRHDFVDRHAGKTQNVCAWIDANLNQSEKLDAMVSRFGMS